MFWRFDVWIDFWQFLKNCRRVSGVTDQCKWKKSIVLHFFEWNFSTFCIFFSQRIQISFVKVVILVFLRCQFILRNTRRNSECTNSSDTKKDRKKNRKSPMRIRHVFRRSVNKDDCVDHFPGVLFGQPLSKVTDGELPPPPIMVSWDY